MQLWNELLPQAELTINLLRTSCLDPNMSAYAMLEGEYNFDHTPLAPPGTRAMVYVDPKYRATWGTHADDAWYVGPTLQHHRCYKFFMPHSKGFRVAQTEKFYPTNCKMPAYNSQDTTLIIARDLVNALRINAKKTTAIHNTHGPDL